ncbi:MAG TPA: hypothetical protein VF083_10165 [Acidimicrobiia bacterium]
MFVHYDTEVPIAMADVEHRLDRLRSDFESWADVAYREGEELRARVGPKEGAVAKEVRLEIGTAEIHRSGLIYPLKWSATGAELLFPRLNAELSLSHVGQHQTKISLAGTYQPPLGPLGKVVDRVLLRRVAESTVKAWVDHLAEALVANHKIS